MAWNIANPEAPERFSMPVCFNTSARFISLNKEGMVVVGIIGGN